MKIEDIFFCLCLGFLIATLLVIFSGYFTGCNFAKNNYSSLMTKNLINESALSECRREGIKYNLFQHALSKIGKRPYTDEYNCLDHAKDLVKELEKVDISSSILINEDRSHSLVAVWIESTTGQFVSLNDNFEILEIRNSNMQVICHK